MKHYTYAHYRKDTNELFYIGKGSGTRAYRVVQRNKHWTNINKAVGRTVEILAYWKTEQEAYDHETLLISCFRDMKKNLVNYSDGGEAPPSRKGIKQTADHIAKRIATRKANGNYKRSDETTMKIVNALKGRVQSEEHKTKNSIAVKKWWDERKGLI